MKKLLGILTLFILLICSEQTQAQSGERGFDYKAHSRMNAKAGRWSKHRIKASHGDPVNLKCSVRKSRQYARKAK
jgi:hypothetical protein